MNSSINETISLLNDGLKGETYTRQGELFVKGFTEISQYEELYYSLLDELKELFNNDYYRWYEDVCRRYARFRRSNSTRYDVVIPQEKKRSSDHTLQEQLAVIRWFIYKRANSQKNFSEGKFKHA